MAAQPAMPTIAQVMTAHPRLRAWLETAEENLNDVMVMMSY
jgi:hypothetical protein